MSFPRFLLFMFLALVMGRAGAQIDAGTVTGTVELAGHVQLLEDATHHLDVQQVLRLPDSAWASNETDKIALGYQQKTWWLKFRLENTSPESLALVLEMGWPLVDHLDVYVVDSNGRVTKHWKTGDRHPYLSRPIASRTFAFPIKTQSHSSSDVLVRLSLEDGAYDLIPLTLSKPVKFFSDKYQDNLVRGGFLGAMLALLLYDFLISGRPRTKAFFCTRCTL